MLLGKYTSLRNKIYPYFFQIISRIIPQAISIGISALIVKQSGLEVFGTYSIILSSISLVFVTFCSAIDTNMVREFDKNSLGIVVLSKFIICLISFPIIYLLARSSGIYWPFLILFLIAFFFQQVVESFVCVFRFAKRDDKSVVPRLIPPVIFITLLFIFKPKNIAEITVFYFVAWGGILYYFKDLDLRRNKIFLYKSILKIKKSAILWCTFLFTQVYGNIDSLIIAKYMSKSDVGNYKIAYTFASISVPVAAIFSFIYLSNLSKAYLAFNTIEFNSLFLKQLLYMFVIGIGTVFGIVLFFPIVNHLLYSGKVSSSYLISAILSIAFMFNILSMACSYALVTLGKDKLILYCTFLNGLLYLMMCYLLIPRYGAQGAAVAMCISYVILFVLYLFLAKRFAMKHFA